MFFCVLSVEPPNHLSEQFRPPIPARASDGVKARRSLPVPFPFLQLLICSFVGQRLPLPLVPASQEQLRREAGMFPNAMLWTIPHRPRLRMPAMEALTRIRRVYFEELPSQNSK